MKLLSDASEYGLRAVLWLANQPRVPHTVQVIAEATGATPGYLIKVLQTLARSGIVTAHRGITGGYALHKDPAEISVLDVVSAIDPVERIRSCPLGLSAHVVGLCPLHRRIDESLASIERDFARTSIAELAIAQPSTNDGECSALSSPASPCCVAGNHEGRGAACRGTGGADDRE